MPSTVSYQRKYYSVSYAELNTIPLKEGNVICTYDTDGWYYDVGNPAGSGTNVVRRQANSIEFVNSLTNPTVSIPVFSADKTYNVGQLVIYEGDSYECVVSVTVPGSWTGSYNWTPSARPGELTTIYVMNTGSTKDEHGNTIQTYSGYVWDIESESFREIFNNSRDFNVKTILDNDKKFYIVGSESANDAFDINVLYKNSNIYVTESGNKIHAHLEGNADSASTAAHSTTCDTATNAINDNASPAKPITGYLNSVVSDYSSNPGTILTFTRGDGTPVQVQVSDTKYEVYTDNPNVPGLVPGTGSVVSSDDTDLLLTGSGWVDKDDIAIPSAQSAENDGEGQNIADTYIKDLSFDNTTREMTVTKGDDDTDTIPIPDSQYSVFTSSTDGLVPHTGASSSVFLRGDATWQVVITPTDIYSGSTAGLVPDAPSGSEKFLRSDGSWVGTFDDDEDGLVPKTNMAATTDILHADGSWSADLDTKNTAGAEQATSVVSPLYLIAADAQDPNPSTVTDSVVYMLNHKLYSNNLEVVDVSSSQNLTNKTFGGNTLASAAFVDKDTVIDPTSPTYVANNVPTNNAVVTYVGNQTGAIYNAINERTPINVIAPNYDDTQTYNVGDLVMYTTVNGVKLFQCTSSNPDAPDVSGWTETTLAAIIASL